MTIPSLKPFRFINTEELNTLQQQLRLSLQQWNDDYALSPLSCELSRLAPSALLHHAALLLTEHSQAMALISTNAFSTVSYSLFGETSPCFNNVSHTLFIELIRHLLGMDAVQESTAFKSEDWCYTGSPALILQIKNNHQMMTLWLHPRWVLSALPKPRLNLKPIHKVEEAIDQTMMACHVELLPLRLTLNDLMHLQIGDVIKTDHLTTTPLHLKHTNHPLGYVTVGEQHFHKSIQLTRSS